MVVTYKELQDKSMRNSIRVMFSRASVMAREDSGFKRFAPDSRNLHEDSLMPDSRDMSPQDRTFLYIQPEPEPGQIGTAGFDLRIGRLIAKSDVVMERVTKQDLLEMPHTVLEPGQEYVLKNNEDGGRIYYMISFEKIGLSSDLEILVDSKSTTGRVGCMSHGVGRTEEGELITALQPFAFPLKVTCGKTRLSQTAVRYKGTPYMTNEEILESEEVRFGGDGTSLQGSLNPKGLLIQFNTQRVYRAKQNDRPINMDAEGTLNWEDYFELIEGNSQLVLDKKTLYLLGSLGAIDLGEVCGLLSREQEVMTGTGAWGHFAGILQPFFRGGITMEFYSHSKRRLSRGDKAGIVIFDKIQGVINRPENYGGSYQDQRPPLLPKMFRKE